MSRGLSVANVSALDGVIVRPVVMVQLEFDEPTGTLYLHDDIGSITANDWDGVSRTWSGLGDFGGIGKLEEGREISPYKVDLVLSGIDAAIASQVLTDDSVLRSVYILIALLNDDRELVDDPHPMWGGKIDDLQVAIGSESVIKVTCESQLASFEKVNNKLQNDSDHQARFQGDKFYEYLPQMLDAKFRWGGKTQTFRPGTSGASFGMPGVGFMGGEIPKLR